MTVKIELGNEISDKELDKRISKIDFFVKINFYERPSKKRLKKEIKIRSSEWDMIYAHYYPDELTLFIGCKFKRDDLK